MLNFQKGIPENVGIPSQAILNLFNRLEGYHIPMHSILILKDEQLIVEGYYKPYDKTMLHRMFSISKSLTALAIAKLEETGFLQLDDPIIKYFPEYVPAHPHKWLQQMTIRHMLMMRTCHASTTYKINASTNWVESFFTTPPTHKPGTIFHYDTSASHTLCALVEKITKLPLLEYLKNTILRAIGFSEESYMLTDPFGVTLGGSGLMATSEDLLRFGYLIMHGGNINDTQLISSSFLHEALIYQTATAVTGPVLSESMGYGYHFWRGQHNSYICYGMGGQLIICLPQYNLLCVTTADTQGIGGGNQLIYNCIYEELLPYLCETNHINPCQNLVVAKNRNRQAASIVTNKKCDQSIEVLSQQKNYKLETDSSPHTYQILEQKLSSLHLETLSEIYPEISSIYSNKNIGSTIHDILFYLEENANGFETMKLNLPWNNEVTEGQDAHSIVSQGTLFLTRKGITLCLPFGFSTNQPFQLSSYDMFCAASGIWLDCNTFYIKIHLLDTAVGSIHIQLVFGDCDVTIFMRKNEETLFDEFSGHLYGTNQRE